MVLRFLTLMRNFLRVFGRTREEMLGRPSVIHWADPDERGRDGSVTP